jgi:hypothetical protein
MWKRFFSVMRSLENLSSGEKRAGWADLVGLPLGSTFCDANKKRNKGRVALRVQPSSLVGGAYQIYDL